MAIYRDANGVEIVYVRKKPTAENPVTGPPSPCLAHMLHYALANGYEECAAPGEADVEVLTVSPEPTAADAEGAAVSARDNSGAIVVPEDLEEEEATGKPKKRSGR